MPPCEKNEDGTDKIDEDGALVIPVTFTAPNPTLLKEYSGTFKLDTVLHEVVPFAA